MGTYKQRIQKEVYIPVAKAAETVGKNANKVVASPGFEEAGSYTSKDAEKMLTDKKYKASIQKFLDQ